MLYTLHSTHCLLASCSCYSTRIIAGSLSLSNLVRQQNSSITNSHLSIGIIPSQAVDSHIHRDVERFKLFDVQLVNCFQLDLLPEFLVTSVPLKMTLLGFFRELAVDDGDNAEPQRKTHQLLHLL